MSASGKWTATIDSPIGKQEIRLDLVDYGSEVIGSATAADGDVSQVFAGTAHGDEVAFSITVPQPMKMTIPFRIKIADDAFAGTAKPGILSASKVVSVRD